MGKVQAISCFDLAGKAGLAHGLIGGRATLETWALKGKHRPDKLVDLRDRIEAHVAECPVDLIAYEAPLPIMALLRIGSRDGTIQMLRSCIAVVEEVAARHRIPIDTWTAQEARKKVIGHGRYPRGLAKKKVMTYARMMRYEPGDDNQADALIGFLYISAKLNPRVAHLSTPLFAMG